MNRTFIFALILMVVFSTANAKTKFKKCENDRFSPPLLSVKVHPDPVVSGKLATFKVSGTIPTKITENTAILVYYNDLASKQIVGDHHLESICEGTECSIEANTPFTKKFKFLTPQLPFEYQINVAVVETFDGQPDLGPYLACAIATHIIPTPT
ncbi:9019_t:CDS:1 [Funneliformis mosseae]|uniref:Phosphatidylglycerol/phosphatidylinositol transfer protein n=1 Tax=Funneliformis mosseae TaxID=27381 RepID=A0A9N9FHB2_FUNMO|nr:9019_t:CDS:1 [Funneliformis mosseae]